MRRRDIIVGLAAANACPSPVVARSGKTPRIGYVLNTPAPGVFEQGFELGLREQGYIVGQNVTIEYRSPHENSGGAELLAKNVDLVVTPGATVARIVRQVAPATPVVFAASRDPVADALVESLSRPGGNITGQSVHAYELSQKRVETLKEAIWGLSRMAVVWNVSSPSRSQIEQSEAAGRTLG